ncbi:TetR/AcrR family transcriptional regulator [Georgenia subflava]|uniref:TetR family transcriptional regulator n=1 Tax=Georgenia subflava TaxID=1622177 RepID=A0A6N7ED12_9MICO|nr:TetR/AcrR family transcriptional regulator [Georgenia subflava]MPV35870.1 TetR family transcriptional regulator [Georgenia subflava]
MSKGVSTKQAILHQGVVAAYRVGVGGLTIGMLATATGMSKSGLYAHFSSKEALQHEVLAQARTEFVEMVVRPALAAPRGEPRMRALFEHWLHSGMVRAPGGCLFVKASAELDEQTGPVRDQLAQDHRDLYDSIARIFRTGVTEGHFRPDADPDQFAVDLDGIMLAFYHWHRLLQDPLAEERARRSFENLLAAARTQESP